LEVARGRLAGLARVYPFRVMTDGFRDDRFRALEACEILLGQQQMLVVIGEQHAPIRADEQHAALPLRDTARGPELWLVLALMPGQSHRRQLASRAVLVGRVHRGRRDLGMRGGPPDSIVSGA